MYSEKVMDHFQNPRNVGEIENASGVGTVGNAKCGDIMRIYFDIDENQVIQDVKFKTFGCGAAVATSSMATELVKGKTIYEALEVTNKAVMEALDGLPPVKVHCSLLAEEAIHAALWDYAEKNGIKIDGLSKPKSDIGDVYKRQVPEIAEEAGKISFGSSVLDAVDLSKSLTKSVYKKELVDLQKRMALLHSELYRRRIPVVIGFEGWDAGGKGGAIHRLTKTMDPRGYEVIPTAAPNDIEKAHHYLWRFWNHMPKAGHVAIFDRTWYGRVMVERIEGFCTEDEWRRAYNEINRMEAQLADAGAIVLKFWLHIDKAEQKKRFEERMENPNKQWKITDEDWRNREKWDEYTKAVDEMILRTSTTYAPWIVVEGNDKLYARIKVLRTVVEAIEKRLK